MDPVEAWIDVAELRRLAQRLMAPQRETKPNANTSEDSPFGELSQDVTTPAESPAQQPAFTVATVAPAVAPVIVESAPVASPEVIADAGTTLAHGISVFRRWLGERFNAKGLFLLDASGATIIDETGNDQLRALAKDWVGNTTLTGGTYVQIKITAEDVLGLFVRESAAGPLIHGVVLPHALDATAAAELRAAMPELP